MNKFLILFTAPLIFSMGFKAFAEEDLKSICGRVSQKQTRFFTDDVGPDGQTFWLKPANARCEYEIAPYALQPSQYGMLTRVSRSADPYVCLLNVTRQGGCSATSRITSLEHISQDSTHEECSTGLSGESVN